MVDIYFSGLFLENLDHERPFLELKIYNFVDTSLVALANNLVNDEAVLEDDT